MASRLWLAFVLAAALLPARTASAAASAAAGSLLQVDPANTTPVAWRNARWGMSVDDVIRAFPGEAKRLEPELKLADGNVVAAGIEAYRLGNHVFRVRFVFGGGKLVLVSLRTPPDRYAGADVFTDLAQLLERELGAPAESTGDDTLVDLRQVRWTAGATSVDLKYIPGVVAIVRHPAPAAGQERQ